MHRSSASLALLAFLVPAAVAAEEVSLEHAEAAGAQFPYVQAGDGDPILFVHGGFSDYRAWEHLREKVAESYRFIAYTQRGFGTAEWPEEPGYALDVHVADLVALLDGWGEPMHLVGWSYSGPIVLQAALDRPDLVRSVVIFEPTTFAVLEGKPEYEQVLTEWDEAWGPVVEASQRGANDEAVELAIEYVFGLPDGGFETLPDANQTLIHDSAHTVPKVFEAPAPTPMTCESLGGIETPVLILWGSETVTFFQAAAKEVAACLPNATLEEIPGTGHGGPIQASEAFLDKTLSFVGKSDGS